MGWRISFLRRVGSGVLFANKEFMRFRTRIQAVNELQNRPAGLGKRARMKEAGGEKWRRRAGGWRRRRRRQPPLLRHRLLDAWVALHLQQQRTVKTNRRSRSQKSNKEQKQQRRYVKKEVEKITKQYGFQSGARHTMETMKRYSDYFKARYFSDAKTGTR